MGNGGGGRRRRLQTRDPGRYQPRANQTSTDHSQNIHLKCPRQCPLSLSLSSFHRSFPLSSSLPPSLSIRCNPLVGAMQPRHLLHPSNAPHLFTVPPPPLPSRDNLRTGTEIALTIASRVTCAPAFPRRPFFTAEFNCRSSLLRRGRERNYQHGGDPIKFTYILRRVYLR